jgi:hypothetical protein
MISLSKRFLFVHVPKTGGNSIQGVLKQYSEDRIVADAPHQDGIERFEVANDRYSTHKHASLAEYHAAMEPAIYTGLYKFSVIRNPWDWMISLYFSPHRGETAWNRDAFMTVVNDAGTLRRYIRTEPGVDGPLDADLECLMRFERLEADFARVCTDLGIPHEPLPRRNQSQREGYAAYYDAELRDFVALKFHEEIAFGNYRFGDAP